MKNSNAYRTQSHLGNLNLGISLQKAPCKHHIETDAWNVNTIHIICSNQIIAHLRVGWHKFTISIQIIVYKSEIRYIEYVFVYATYVSMCVCIRQWYKNNNNSKTRWSAWQWYEQRATKYFPQWKIGSWVKANKGWMTSCLHSTLIYQFHTCFEGNVETIIFVSVFFLLIKKFPNYDCLNESV